MRHDVILVLLDGLNHSVARDCMGHLQALCGAGRGQSYRLECELPSLSRTALRMHPHRSAADR